MLDDNTADWSRVTSAIARLLKPSPTMSLWRPVSPAACSRHDRKGADRDIADEVERLSRQSTAAQDGSFSDEARRAATCGSGKRTALLEQVRGLWWENTIEHLSFPTCVYARCRLLGNPGL